MLECQGRCNNKVKDQKPKIFNIKKVEFVSDSSTFFPIGYRFTVSVFVDILVEFDKYVSESETNPNNNLMRRWSGLSIAGQ